MGISQFYLGVMFVCGTAVGAGLGILYDILRITRLLCGFSRKSGTSNGKGHPEKAVSADAGHRSLEDAVPDTVKVAVPPERNFSGPRPVIPAASTETGGKLDGIAPDVLSDRQRPCKAGRKSRHTGKNPPDCPPSLRHTRRFRQMLLFAEDLLFSMTCGVALLLLLYYGNDGQFRMPAVIGMGCGFFLYYQTVGRLVMALSEATVRLLRRFAHALFHLLLLPCRGLSRCWMRLPKDRILRAFHIRHGNKQRGHSEKQSGDDGHSVRRKRKVKSGKGRFPPENPPAA